MTRSFRIAGRTDIGLRDKLYRCQFCGGEAPASRWEPDDRCPGCGRQYDVLLAQDSEE